MRICVYVCFQSSLTTILAEPSGKRGSSLFNYQGVLLCIESLYSYQCLLVFKAFSFKENRLDNRIWRHTRKRLTTVQQHTEPLNVECAGERRYLSSTVNTGISPLNRQHLLRQGRSKTHALTNSYRHTKALVLHCAELGCKGDCCFSEASVSRERERAREGEIK